jgi:hypothetical protein
LRYFQFLVKRELRKVEALNHEPAPGEGFSLIVTKLFETAPRADSRGLFAFGR